MFRISKPKYETVRGMARLVECAAVGALVIGGILATFDPANSGEYHNIGAAIGTVTGLALGANHW